MLQSSHGIRPRERVAETTPLPASLPGPAHYVSLSWTCFLNQSGAQESPARAVLLKNPIRTGSEAGDVPSQMGGPIPATESDLEQRPVQGPSLPASQGPVLPDSTLVPGPFLPQAWGWARRRHFSLNHTSLETQLPQHVGLCEFRRLGEQAVERGKDEKGARWEVVLAFQVGKTKKELLGGRRGLGKEPGT